MQRLFCDHLKILRVPYEAILFFYVDLCMVSKLKFLSELNFVDSGDANTKAKSATMSHKSSPNVEQVTLSNYSDTAELFKKLKFNKFNVFYH